MNTTQSNPWVKFSERAPTEADSDIHGHVLFMFEDNSVGVFGYTDTFVKNRVVSWTSIPKVPEPTRDDLDLAEFNRFKDTYSLHSSMVNSLNLKLAYEAGLREARKQAREAFAQISYYIKEDQAEEARKFEASIAQ
jgi:hypothetical protein